MDSPQGLLGFKMKVPTGKTRTHTQVLYRKHRAGPENTLSTTKFASIPHQLWVHTVSVILPRCWDSGKNNIFQWHLSTNNHYCRHCLYPSSAGFPLNSLHSLVCFKTFSGHLRLENRLHQQQISTTAFLLQKLLLGILITHTINTLQSLQSHVSQLLCWYSQ